MAKKQSEPKIILEREYVVPLRRGWLKVPKYKRANKAVKTLKEFIVRHMKIYDRDLRKIKVDILLNNELRFRGMKKPPAKIKVKAKKFEDDIVRVELVDIPIHIKFARLREEKKKAERDKKAKSEEKKEETEKPTTEEKKEDAKEKEKTSKEESLMQAKQQAKEMKHVSGKQKQPTIHRVALKK